jgi:hypothetical protein
VNYFGYWFGGTVFDQLSACITIEYEKIYKKIEAKQVK